MFDEETFGAAVARSKEITAADRQAAEQAATNAAASQSEAEASAASAAASARLAQQHSIGFEDGGTGLILKPIEQEA